MYTYFCTIRRVVDGDTIDVLVDLGFSVCIRERVRLAGIDTPESRTRDKREKKYGKLATARVAELMPVGQIFEGRCRSYHSRGKYGRAMMDFVLPGGALLCETLVSEHLAVPYGGEHKREIRALHEANWAHLEGVKNGG